MDEDHRAAAAEGLVVNQASINDNRAQDEGS
jgi:hypothetical protein